MPKGKTNYRSAVAGLQSSSPKKHGIVTGSIISIDRGRARSISNSFSGRRNDLRVESDIRDSPRATEVQARSFEFVFDAEFRVAQLVFELFFVQIDQK